MADFFGDWLILENGNLNLVKNQKKRLRETHGESFEGEVHFFKPNKESKIDFKKGKKINLGGVATTGRGYVGDPDQSLSRLKRIASSKVAFEGEDFEFRIGQKEILKSILSSPGKNILGTLPTGGGKSLIYELAAYELNRIQEGPTIVISPLNSLQEDQVQNLKKRWKEELDPVNLNGVLGIEEKSQIKSKILSERSNLILMQPEELIPTSGYSQMKHHFLLQYPL